MIIIVSGVSGAGKNTIINKLIEKTPNMFFFKSATTRPRRPGETIYDFCTPEEFEEKRKNGEFFEVEESHGYFYATQNSELKKIIDNPQNIYIKDIEVHGNRKLREFFKGKVKAISIFLDVPDEILYQRLIERGESDERAKIRISRGTMERQYLADYDLVIQNYDMEKTVETIIKFINKNK